MKVFYFFFLLLSCDLTYKPKKPVFSPPVDVVAVAQKNIGFIPFSDFVRSSLQGGLLSAVPLTFQDQFASKNFLSYFINNTQYIAATNINNVFYSLSTLQQAFFYSQGSEILTAEIAALEKIVQDAGQRSWKCSNLKVNAFSVGLTKNLSADGKIQYPTVSSNIKFACQLSTPSASVYFGSDQSAQEFYVFKKPHTLTNTPPQRELLIFVSSNPSESVKVYFYGPSVALPLISNNPASPKNYIGSIEVSKDQPAFIQIAQVDAPIISISVTNGVKNPSDAELAKWALTSFGCGVKLVIQSSLLQVAGMLHAKITVQDSQQTSVCFNCNPTCTFVPPKCIDYTTFQSVDANCTISAALSNQPNYLNLIAMDSTMLNIPTTIGMPAFSEQDIVVQQLQNTMVE